MRILDVIEAWRRVFSLRTLGGGYSRYFLILGDGGILLMETDNVAVNPPWRPGSSGDPLSDLINSTIEEIRRRLKGGASPFSVRGLTAEEVITLLEKRKRELGIRWIRLDKSLTRDDVEKVKLSNRGILEMWGRAGGKMVFEINPEILPRIEEYIRLYFSK